MITRTKKIDKSLEKSILTGLIISDRVIEKLHPLISSPLIFQLELCQIVSSWVLDYYHTYKQAPKSHLRDLFHIKQSNLPPQITNEIQHFLALLSEEFEQNPEINEDFLIDQGETYLKTRQLELAVNQLNSLLEEGKLKEAEHFLSKLQKQNIKTTTAHWINPIEDFQFINTVLDEKETPLLELKGKLHELVGGLYRGMVLGIMGPFKRGKSWFLQDIAIDAVLSKRRVVLISLEMPATHQTTRIYSQITQAGDSEQDYILPCFDCYYNQVNTCNKPQRTCRSAVPEKFSPDDKTYKPCTACRDSSNRSDFKPTTWFTVVHRKALNRITVRRELTKLRRMVGSNKFYLITYPAFSATLSDIERDLDQLEIINNFIPDVIVVDYADILAPEHKFKEYRHQIDEIWKRLKQIAVERSCLVVSGSQGNRGSIDKEILDEKDMAEEARKLAHADIWLSLNQTHREKERGVWRIGVLEHRWKKFDKKLQLLALQQLELGQPFLDGELIYYEPKKGELL